MSDTSRVDDSAVTSILSSNNAEVWESMDEEFKALCVEEYTQYQSLNKDLLMAYYDRGSVARKIRSNAGFRSSAISDFCAVLKLDMSSVYKSIILSTMYVDRKSLELVVAKAKAKKVTLCWNHYTAVVGMTECLDKGSDPNKYRHELINRVINEGLSHRQIVAEVQATASPVSAPASDKAVSMPSLIRKITKGSERYSQQLKGMLDGISTDFEEVIFKVDDVDVVSKDFQIMISGLQETQASLNSMIDKFKSLVPVADKAIRKRVADKNAVLSKESEELSNSTKPRVQKV